MQSYNWCVIKYLIKIQSVALEANREIKAFVAKGEAIYLPQGQKRLCGPYRNSKSSYQMTPSDSS